MHPVSYARHQFPAEIIRHATWLYLRFTLSYRDVEELLAERGIGSSYETVRRWVLKFGPVFARNLRRLRPRPTGRWHLEALSREPERDHKGPANGSGQAAAVAICHACSASALKSRSVRRETRWR